ncbi:MAG TPA: hypothetical protein VER33_24455 [Polyangiaceae bacterium]|nr:hypothetical protein [Polyangiaceae bacterium]
MRRRLACGALAALALGCLFSVEASAAPGDVVLQRTQTAVVDPEAEPDTEAIALAQRVDALLHEAVQDLGLSVDVSERPALDRDVSEAALLERAAEHWVFAPSLERAGGQLVLRIAAVPPASSIIYVRTQSVDPEELDMRVVLMLRDLVEASRGGSAPRRQTDTTSPAPRDEPRPRSNGRAILALNAALLGGYAGYSLQQTGGSADERLTYPLVALGAGVGLGSSMLVAEEWDIGVGDAWFLSAGMWWPTASGWLLSESYGAGDDERYAYGLLGATAGLTLSAAVLSFGHASEGGAALAHSGGAFGTVLGGLTELLVSGSTDDTPRRGMGYGAGVGVLLASAASTQLKMPASRVLLIDLAASLGGLTGAALASPLLLVEEGQSDASQNRFWLASVVTGTLAGGVIGWWTTEATQSGTSDSDPPLLPTVGVIGHAPTGGPVYGASVQGTW